jgi:hypothetical protein
VHEIKNSIVLPEINSYFQEKMRKQVGWNTEEKYDQISKQLRIETSSQKLKKLPCIR